MKRLKLREEVKIMLVGVAFVAALTTLIIYGVDRINKINNGEMVVISESNMD